VEKTKSEVAVPKIARAKNQQEKHVKHKSVDSPPSNCVKIKAKRHNYSVGENKTELETALSKWTKKTGHFWDSNGEERSLQIVCYVVGIPYNTLAKYAGDSKTINIQVGGGVG
jgi:hypothetical protein